MSPETIMSTLNAYAKSVVGNKSYMKTPLSYTSVKTNRKLDKFDCIHAPCAETCPAHQNIPGYINAVKEGRLEDAFDIVSDTIPPFDAVLEAMPESFNKVVMYFTPDKFRLASLQATIFTEKPQMMIRGKIPPFNTEMMAPFACRY